LLDAGIFVSAYCCEMARFERPSDYDSSKFFLGKNAWYAAFHKWCREKSASDIGGSVEVHRHDLKKYLMKWIKSTEKEIDWDLYRERLLHIYPHGAEIRMRPVPWDSNMKAGLPSADWDRHKANAENTHNLVPGVYERLQSKSLSKSKKASEPSGAGARADSPGPAVVRHNVRNAQGHFASAGASNEDRAAGGARVNAGAAAGGARVGMPRPAQRSVSPEPPIVQPIMHKTYPSKELCDLLKGPITILSDGKTMLAIAPDQDDLIDTATEEDFVSLDEYVEFTMPADPHKDVVANAFKTITANDMYTNVIMREPMPNIRAWNYPEELKGNRVTAAQLEHRCADVTRIMGYQGRPEVARLVRETFEDFTKEDKITMVQDDRKIKKAVEMEFLTCLKELEDAKDADDYETHDDTFDDLLNRGLTNPDRYTNVLEAHREYLMEGGMKDLMEDDEVRELLKIHLKRIPGFTKDDLETYITNRKEALEIMEMLGRFKVEEIKDYEQKHKDTLDHIVRRTYNMRRFWNSSCYDSYESYKTARADMDRKDRDLRHAQAALDESEERFKQAEREKNEAVLAAKNMEAQLKVARLAAQAAQAQTAATAAQARADKLAAAKTESDRLAAEQAAQARADQLAAEQAAIPVASAPEYIPQPPPIAPAPMHVASVDAVYLLPTLEEIAETVTAPIIAKIHCKNLKILCFHPYNIALNYMYGVPLPDVGPYEDTVKEIKRDMKTHIANLKADPRFKDLTPSNMLIPLVVNAVKTSMSGTQGRMDGYTLKRVATKDTLILDKEGQITKFGKALKAIATLDPPFAYRFDILSIREIEKAVDDTADALAPLLQTDDMEALKRLTKTALAVIRTDVARSRKKYLTQEDVYLGWGWDYEEEFLLIVKEEEKQGSMGGSKDVVSLLDDDSDDDAGAKKRKAPPPPPAYTGKGKGRAKV
jgi:hypothetical protein